MTVKMLYFARLREKMGRGEEQIALPEAVVTVADLLNYLDGLGEPYATALEDRDALRVAVNQRHVEPDEPLGEAQEIAIFPPMTGG